MVADTEPTRVLVMTEVPDGAREAKRCFNFQRHRDKWCPGFWSLYSNLRSLVHCVRGMQIESEAELPLYLAYP